MEKNMTMTNEEIVRDYRAAKNKLKQVGILAELNLCKKMEIAKILLDAGEWVPGQFTKFLNAPQTPESPETQDAVADPEDLETEPIRIKQSVSVMRLTPVEAAVLANYIGDTVIDFIRSHPDVTSVCWLDMIIGIRRRAMLLSGIDDENQVL